jgi:putative transposase
MGAEGQCRSRHSVSLLIAHLVVVPQYRRKVLDAMLNETAALWRTILAQLGGELIECNGEPDHVHVLLLQP